MSKTDDLKALHIRDLHRAGIYLDTHPASNDIPPNGFIACKNTRFRQGAVEVVPGFLPFGAPALDSRVMYGDQFFRKDGSDFLLAVSQTSPWVYDPNAGTWSQVTPAVFTGGNDDFYDADTNSIYDTFVITNNKDRVKKWTGTGNFADLGGLGTAFPAGSQNVSQAKIVRFINGFSILLATSENGVSFPQRVRWSRQGFLEQWDNDAFGNGQAGFYDLSDSPDWILGAEVLSGSLLIMKERSFWLMQYVGLPTIWFFRRVVAGVGLLSPRGYVDMGDEIIFVGQDNFYSFAGYTLSEVGDNRIKTFFFNDVDPQYVDRIQAFIIEEEDEIWFNYPSIRRVNGVGEVDSAVVYNHVTKTWSIRDAQAIHWFYYIQFQDYTWQSIPNFPWNVTSGAWGDRRLLSQFPLNLFGTPSGQIMSFGGIYSMNGAAYDKYATTKLQDFQRPDILKRVERVELSVDRTFSGLLNVYVAHCSGPGEAIVYDGPFTINMAQGKARFFNCDITDKYFGLKFETVNTGDAWRVIEYEFWFRERQVQ